MAKLVVVSNRVSTPSSAKRAGGLAVAVEGALRKYGGVWIGWNGVISECDREGAFHQLSSRNIDYVTFGFSESEHRLYYECFSNRTLWPAFHYREDLIEHNADAVASYHAVNGKFADLTARVLSAGDLVWVQDYHLFGLGAALRGKGVQNPIGFFLHVPFPPEGIIDALPSGFDLADLLSSYDVVGVQTERDANNLRSYITSHPARIGTDGGYGRNRAISPVIKVFPVGIGTELISRAARMARKSTLAKMTSMGLLGRRLMISVERLDYSKGIPQRLRAYDRFLSEYPEWRRRVSLLQIAPLSRDTLPEYSRLADDVDRLSGKVTGRHADLTWSPLHYTNSYVAPFPLAGLLRAARVGLVTPLRDGMNLVSKEYVAAQDASDPGVLILSKFAGAAEQLKSALLVDPRDSQEVSVAIKQALEMPIDERRFRHADMMDHITAHTAKEWCDNFVDELIATQLSGTKRAENMLATFGEIR